MYFLFCIGGQLVIQSSTLASLTDQASDFLMHMFVVPVHLLLYSTNKLAEGCVILQ